MKTCPHCGKQLVPVSDSVSLFAASRLMQVAGQSVAAMELYTAYRGYCGRTTMDVVTLTQFGRDMAALGYAKSLTHGRVMYRDIAIVR